MKKIFWSLLSLKLQIAHSHCLIRWPALLFPNINLSLLFFFSLHLLSSSGAQSPQITSTSTICSAISIFLLPKFSQVLSLSCSIAGGELFDRVIEDEFVLSEKACCIFTKQILEGISYIHRQQIIHLDLKVIVRIVFLPLCTSFNFKYFSRRTFCA